MPGDILVFDAGRPPLHSMPCDALLLAGEVVAQEAALTGESVPVTKTAFNIHASAPIDSDRDRREGQAAGTGESVSGPSIARLPGSDPCANASASTQLDVQSLTPHMLFAGTRLLQCSPSPAPSCSKAHKRTITALVVRTGMPITQSDAQSQETMSRNNGCRFSDSKRRSHSRNYVSATSQFAVYQGGAAIPDFSRLHRTLRLLLFSLSDGALYLKIFDC